MVIGILSFLLGCWLIVALRKNHILKKEIRVLLDKQAVIPDRIQNYESLIKEIHHRIKNNFQLITDLLEIQIEKSTTEESKRFLRQSAHRLRSMAILYNHLYSVDHSRLDLSTYLEELMEQALIMFSHQKHPRLEFYVPKIEVPSDTAMLLGIVVNELVTNAFKYGLDTKDPRISLRIEQKSPNNYELNFGDNGKVKSDIDLKNTGFGLQLIGRLAFQLNGDFTFSRDTRLFTVSFEL